MSRLLLRDETHGPHCRRPHRPTATGIGASLGLLLAILTLGSPAIDAATETELPNGGWGGVWSPDATQIAFLSGTPHSAPDAWIMDRDGSHCRRLTWSGVDELDWSQGLPSLTATISRRRFGEVVGIDLSHDDETYRVEGLPPNASIPRYSPNGDLFAFTAADSQEIRSLWVGTRDLRRVESVTRLLNVRSFLWGPNSRHLYYEAGKTYGVGIWDLDLATMQTRNLVNNYVGPPTLSPEGERIAFSYPIQPGHYEVHVIDLDGTELAVVDAPRMTVKRVQWSPDGQAVLYLGQELGAEDEATVPSDEEKPEQLHPEADESAVQHHGEVALWRLDLESAIETRVSPESLHLSTFTLSPVDDAILLEGVRTDGFGTDLFTLDDGELRRLTTSSPSWWGAAPTPDSRRVAYLTDRQGFEAIEVCDLEGNLVRDYPGALPPRGTRLGWMATTDALVVSWPEGMAALADSGKISWPDEKSHRRVLYAKPCLTSDKIVLDAIPAFGELPGLYELRLVDGSLQQIDLRFPPEGELGVEFYLQPDYSTDGSRIAFSDRIEIWTMNADGTNRRCLTDYDRSNLNDLEKATFASTPIWSRRGDRICFTTTVVEAQRSTRELWLLDVLTGEREKIFAEEIRTGFQANLEDFTTPPFFDAADEHIVFTAMRDKLPNLASYDLARHRTKWLTRDGGLGARLLPDEGLIVYTSLRGNRETLRLMNTDGSGDHALLPRDEVRPGQVSGR